MAKVTKSTKKVDDKVTVGIADTTTQKFIITVDKDGNEVSRTPYRGRSPRDTKSFKAMELVAGFVSEGKYTQKEIKVKVRELVGPDTEHNISVSTIDDAVYGCCAPTTARNKFERIAQKHVKTDILTWSDETPDMV